MNQFASSSLFVLGAVVALPACMEDSSERPPAGDAGTALVHVAFGGAPVADAVVIVYAPSGEVQSRFATGSDGKVIVPVDPGASVTVAAIPEHNNRARLRILSTAIGVHPGNLIVFGDVGGDPDAEIARASVTLPGGHANATHYTIDLGGTAGQTAAAIAPVHIPISAESVGVGDILTVVSEARDTDDNAIAYAVAADVPRGADGNTSVTLGPWRTDWAPLDIVFQNAPAAIASAIPIYAADGVLFARTWSQFAMTNAGTATFAFPHARDVYDAVLIDALVDRSGPISKSGHGVLRRWHTGVPARAVVDVATDMLPAVGPSSQALTNAAAPTVSWKTAGDVSGADALVVRTSWVDGEWTAVAPAGTPSPLTLPQLPADLADYHPDAASATHELSFVDADVTPDYKAMLALGYEQLDNAFETPAYATVRMSVAHVAD